MKFFIFLGKLFSSSQEASMRRFIAFFLLLPYTVAIGIGLYMSVKISDYTFFLTSLLAAGIPIMLAYFLLTWEHVLEIVKNVDIGLPLKKDNKEDDNNDGGGEVIIPPVEPIIQ